MRNLQLFEEEINKKELSDKPPPVSYKAYCAALFQQLDVLRQLAIQNEAKLNKQGTDLFIFKRRSDYKLAYTMTNKYLVLQKVLLNILFFINIEKGKTKP